MSYCEQHDASIHSYFLCFQENIFRVTHFAKTSVPEFSNLYCTMWYASLCARYKYWEV